MKTKLVYLANPYTHKDPDIMQERYEKACEFTAALKRNGWYVFSPIAHSHGPAQYGLPKDYEYWSGYCELMLPKCDIMMVLKLDGWQESVGVQAEIDLWHKTGKPILLLDFNEMVAIQ